MMRVEDMRQPQPVPPECHAHGIGLRRVDDGADALFGVVNEIGIIVGKTGNELDLKPGHEILRIADTTKPRPVVEPG
jgi:hypothetical protein